MIKLVIRLQLKKFVQNVKDAELVMLPEVGHGYSVPRNWSSEFVQAYKELASQSNAPSPLNTSRLNDLPLVEVPSTKEHSKDLLCVFISGDGEWAGIDQGVSKRFAAEGIATVGINLLKYLWKKKTPHQAAIDLQRVVQFYKAKWSKEHVMFVGYSLGADILPFMLRDIPKSLQQKTVLAVFLSPSSSVDFQFHLSYWMGGGSEKNYLRVLPALQSLYELHLLCIYGRDESKTICRDLNLPNVQTVAVPGNHHYNGNYNVLADEIFKSLGQ